MWCLSKLNTIYYKIMKSNKLVKAEGLDAAFGMDNSAISPSFCQDLFKFEGQL